MKQKTTLLLLLISLITFAQAPAGYYSTATGTGATLKTQLYNIIKGHTDNGYDGLYTIYQTSDIDKFYENDGTIMDMYSENPTSNDPYNYSPTITSDRCGTYNSEMDCFNREHIIPQSTFSEKAPMVSDAHHVPPTDGYVNNRRSNYPHGMVASTTWVSLNGSKLGSSAVPGYTGTVFEPNNEFKGDIARMYFYFVTRYENTVASYSFPAFSGNAYPAIDQDFLNMLIKWHTDDPVSAFEIARNNAIYAKQDNRNPYIDNPNYVDLVWGAGTCPSDTQAPTTPTSLAAGSITATTMELTWGASTDNTGVTNYDIYVDGIKYASSGGNTSVILNGLSPSTTYAIYVIAKDCKGNLSTPSNTINATTQTQVSGSATDLFFSEYVEGSGNNKALEITNLTGASVDLSAYSIKKQTNGAGAWGAALVLTGNLYSGSVFTIVHSSIATTCYASSNANISTAVDALLFNGNDPIGLFKNDVLIDIIGTFNGGTADFAANQTLRRKPTVTSPNTTFDKAGEWEIFPIDTCSGLGDTTLDAETFNKTNFRIYPNPSNGYFNIDFKEFGDYNIEIFNTLGQKVYSAQENNKNHIEINNLQKGIYLVKISKNTQSIVEKIVIN